MKTIRFIGAALLVSVSLAGCQFNARSAEDYQKETKKLLQSKKKQIKSCYDEVLKKDKKAKGVVAVTFTVAPKTGAIENAKLDEKKTTAPEALGQCVLSALEGLALDPPDAREGAASFEYEFKANEPKQL